MTRKEYGHCGSLAVTALVMVSLVLALPASAVADGGPILSDPQLWAMLKEGQQVAVIRLDSSSTATIDLFVSMLDESGQAHEVTFFVPLGKDPWQFRTLEETSREFDESVTEPLDTLLRAEIERQAAYKTSVAGSLLLGTLLLNGGWSWPFWLLWVLSGCSAAGMPTPLGTYETPSSRVAIYGVNEDTDLQALIATAGLSPAVQETLSRLRGQQIAVVSLQTQPASQAGSAGGGPAGQPGLHLSWQTALAANSAQAAYAYPLGTGSAWAHPIELTRIYVTAPPGADFAIQYPELGQDLSGYTAGGWSSRSVPRIQQATSAAFAVEEAVGDFGHVWRITYKQSNSAEDLAVTRLPALSTQTQSLLTRQRLEAVAGVLSWIAAPLIALAIWSLVWHYVMRRMLGIEYSWRERRFWLEALGWALLYPLTNGVAVFAGVVLTAITGGMALFVAVPVVLITALGGISIFLFARNRAPALGASKRQAAMAYVTAVVIANALFLSFGVFYLALLVP